MRFINSVNASVALHVSGDEVVPEHGANSRELIEFLGKTYEFAVKPPILPGVPGLLQNLVFQSGAFTAGKDKWPIIQLASVPNGDIVTAVNTDTADLILNDYMKRLDDELGFRFASATKQRRSYQSNIVVQFDSGIEEKIQGIMKIEAILTREIPRPSLPFKIKKLSFGSGDTLLMLTLDTIEKSDFSLERRGQEPYSENKYFCSAPISTSEHIRILETLEKELS